MSTIVASRIIFSNDKSRPPTPIRRRGLTSLQCPLMENMNIKQALLDAIDHLQDSSDTSTQLLIRLYHHKSIRLHDQPEKLFLFQQEMYSGLRRLHPTVVNCSSLKEENQLCFLPEPVITSRSAQATIRKLH